MMRFNVTALALTAGLLWGGAVLVVALANLIWPPYGTAFLEMTASVYPGYEAVPTAGPIVMGTLYAFVDGAIGGAIFGWLYNLLSRRFDGDAA